MSGIRKKVSPGGDRLPGLRRANLGQRLGQLAAAWPRRVARAAPNWFLFSSAARHPCWGGLSSGTKAF